MIVTDPASITKALESLENAKQQAAVFKYISDNPHSYTHEIARGAECINVPNCAKFIQEKLDPLGLVIAHYPPKTKRKNRYGYAVSTHQWVILNQDYFSAKNEKPHQSRQLTGLDMKLIEQDNLNQNITPIRAARKVSRKKSTGKATNAGGSR